MSAVDQIDVPVDPAANIGRIADQLRAAVAEVARRDIVTITAVSKKHGADRITPLLQAGHRVFGENRVQEAQQKWPPLREKFDDIDLRLIGPLQSNKAGEAVQLFDAIETIDRPKIARSVAVEMEKQGRRPVLFVQINTGGEVQKSGVTPEESDGFLAQCRNEFGLAITGLMCIPPADEPPAPHFALLAKIAARNGLTGLSMGMSGDFETAAQLGATHVRIGTEIFGRRP